MKKSSNQSKLDLIHCLKDQNVLIDKQIVDLALNHNLINPFDESFLSGCSYDLRVGSVLRSRNRLSTYDLSKNTYVIESGECITIETLEEVDFRDILLFGIISNKHSILAKGLFHPITTIDPGFKGTLAVTFMHLGNIRYELKQGDKIAALSFHPIYPKPKNIYGITQSPSYREGSTDIALIVDKPKELDDDMSLASMYGKPIEKLYEKIANLENNFQLATLNNESRKIRGRKIVYWSMLFALLSGLSGSLITLYWKEVVNFLKSLF